MCCWSGSLRLRSRAGLLGCGHDQIVAALSHAFADGGALRGLPPCTQHGAAQELGRPATPTSRGVQHALWALGGEVSIPSVLSAPRWGFHEVAFGGGEITLGRPLGSYVMEHVLFKVSFPAEFHAQTAVEAAIELSPQVRSRLDEIDQVTIWTQRAGKQIIDKTGPLHNPADRDHCLQYMTAIGLIYGELTADHYLDEMAADPRIDELRDKMLVVEEPGYTADYLDPELRSIANAVQVEFSDGTSDVTSRGGFPRSGIPAAGPRRCRSCETSWHPRWRPN